MSLDDFATARRYPAMDEDAAVEAAPSANAFTPISAVERLREKPRHRRQPQGSRQTMLIPGQRYTYDTYQAQESPPPPYAPAADYPAEEGPFFENAPMETIDTMPLADRYQQEYWAHLQEVASTTPQPTAAENAPHVPAYLSPYGMGAQSDPADHFTWQSPQPPKPMEAGYPGGPRPRGDVLDEIFGQGAGIDTQYVPMEADGLGPWPMAEEYPFEEPQSGHDAGGFPSPYERGAAWEQRNEEPAPASTKTRKMPKAGDRPSAKSLFLRAKAGAARAFAREPLTEKPRTGLGKVAAVCAITVMLVFCAIEMGRIVLDMLQNEQEMKAVREEYYAMQGVELSKDASRVELLPPGVTFTPTATPQPAQESLETENAGGTDAAAMAQEPEIAATQNVRSKASSYEDNPLGNIREEFEPLRADNPDTVGRLVIDGMMDEIVVLRNNTYYLTHNARGSFSAAGAVFMDESCAIRKPPENALLRGQSATENSPFRPLLNLGAGDAAYLRKHAVIRLDTLYEEAQYVVFAVVVASSDPHASNYFNYAGYPSFQSDRQMESYVMAARQLSLYEIPVDVLPTDRLLTLSTIGDGTTKDCLVVMARKLRAGESAVSLDKSLSAIRAY